MVTTAPDVQEMGVMTDNFRVLGIPFLKDFFVSAISEASVQADYWKQLDLTDVCSRLERRLSDVEGYPNQRFNGLADAVALCFILYKENPRAYSQLIQGVCKSSDEALLDRYEGLCLLDTLQHGLADDHDYVLNRALGTIEVVSDETAGQGLYPALFREVLMQARAAAPTQLQDQAESSVKAQDTSMPLASQESRTDTSPSPGM